MRYLLTVAEEMTWVRRFPHDSDWHYMEYAWVVLGSETTFVVYHHPWLLPIDRQVRCGQMVD